MDMRFRCEVTIGFLALLASEIISTSCAAPDDGLRKASESTTAAPAAVVSQAVSTDKPEDEAGHRHPDVTACALDASAAKHCQGFAGYDLADPRNSVQSIQFLAGLNFKYEQTDWISRSVPAGSNLHSAFKIARIGDIQAVEMRNLGSAGVVVARILVQAGSSPDNRYGLEHLSGYERNYYIVVSDYSDTINGDRQNSIPFATWKILRVRSSTATTAGAIEVAKRGVYRYCRMKHTGFDSEFPADFLSCKNAGTRSRINAEVAQFLTGQRASVDSLWHSQGALKNAGGDVRNEFRSFIESRTDMTFSASYVERNAVAIAQSRLEQLDDPAWMRCGAGCCTAEEN
jgi:hypothetical protein